MSGAAGPGPGAAAAISALRRERPSINSLTWSPLRRDSAKSPSRSLYSAIAAARPDPDSAGRPRWEKGDSALARGGCGVWGSCERWGSPGGTCGIAHSHKMFPFRLSFPEPHRVRQEGLEKLVSKLGKLHTSLTWGRGGCCGHLLRDRDSPCSMRGGIKAWEHCGAGWAPSFHLCWCKTANPGTTCGNESILETGI